MPRILIVAPNWIGDALLAQPLLARLRKKLPGVVIDALAPAWTAPVLRRMPEIKEVIGAPFDHGELALAARWRLGRSLRSRGYDETIVLPNSFKSALVPFFAGIPLRAGYVGEMRYGLLNRVHRLDEKALPLMAERYAQLAEKPGTMPALPLPQTRLAVDEANLVLDLRRLGLSRAKPIAAFCPGAEYGPSTRWPARHFAALAKKCRAGQRLDGPYSAPGQKAAMGLARERPSRRRSRTRFASSTASLVCGRGSAGIVPGFSASCA